MANASVSSKPQGELDAPVAQRLIDNRQLWIIFSSLMLTMLLSSTNITMVSPAMPRIVAELGGMEYYTWVAVSTLLSATVLMPVVGKLSDLYGRKPFYLGGIVVFLLGSVLSGLAPDFWSLVVARGIQGLGIGVIPPLSQAIIGDLVSSRERGKYQGIIDVTYAISAILGPLIGGVITDGFGWRWLFFANLPLGLIAFVAIVRFLNIPKVRRSPSIDYPGILTFSFGLTVLLLVLSLGGNEYAWDSPQIVGLTLAGIVSLGIFAAAENAAKEPMLPLMLWRNSIFTYSNIANAMIGAAFYAGVYFLPVYVQGVLGASATNSGLILVPLMLSLTGMSMVSGQFVARTGRYKHVVVLGTIVATVGCYLLTRMDVATPYYVVLINMVIVGVGMGPGTQMYNLIVQNAVDRRHLGIATGTTQLSRSVGRTAGTAILGTVLAQRMFVEIGARLPAGSAVLEGQSGVARNVDAVIDPTLLAGLSQPVVDAVREGLAASLQTVFWTLVPALGIALLATLLVKEIPLSSVIDSEEAAGPGEV